MKHILEQRYRAVWETTLQNAQLSADSVAGSTFFFEDNSTIPKRFDTYAIVCCLPFPKDFQETLQNYWEYFMALLGNPVSYGVEPQNRHVEIFLFSRPEEVFAKKEVQVGIEQSLSLGKNIAPFNITFCYPFMTPDGTMVVPGFESNEAMEAFRLKLRETLTAYPKKQSQWLHTSLGRILEPLTESQLAPLLQDMEANWGKVIGEISVNKLLWTWEKQWYMIDKEIIETADL